MKPASLRAPSAVLALAIASFAAEAARAEDGTVKSRDGVAIRWHAEGRGEPTVVLVHCWTCDRHLWDEQVTHLAPRRRVVTLDLAGHGESGKGRAAWTIEAFAADVRAVVDRMHPKRVVLVGHSMGGPVVVEAARTLRGRLAGVVLVDTLLDVEHLDTKEAVETYLKPFRDDYASAVSKFLPGYMYTAQTSRAVIDRTLAAAVAAPPAMAVAALESTWSYDPRPALREIHAPVRAINADKFPTDVEAMRRYAPQFEAAIVKGVGHYVMLERPDEFDGKLDDALDAMGDGPSPNARAR